MKFKSGFEHVCSKPGAKADRRRFLLGAAAFCLAGRVLRAQSQEPVAQFKARTQLVNVFATVRDRNGALVQTLKKEDFSISEDGRSEPIAFFSHENDLPLTLGILVDTSPSEAKMIDEEREASRTFLKTVLDPKKDTAFVMHFDRKVELLEDLTASTAKLDKALDKLEDVGEEPAMERRHDDNLLGGEDRSSRNRDGADGGTTHLFDAVYLASTHVLKGRTGRKALIVVGDGDDMGSRITQSRAIRAAQQAEAMIYCIRIVDKDFGKDGHKRRFSLPVGIAGIPGIPGLGGGPGGGPGGGQGGGPGGGSGGGPGGGAPGGPGGNGGGAPDRSEGKKHMEALSEQTGGALFEVTKKASLGDIYAQIGEELRTQYSLGYKPDPRAGDGFRHILVTVKPKNLYVQTREGYYPDES
jgi:VWFA-related protein